MTENNQFDEVEDFASFEATSDMTAAEMPVESENPDDHDPIKENQFLYPPIHAHPRNDLE
ncbi:hypothetical protein ACFQ88_07310 [Paenibacillus sp. NPDC056579]|uniref:hypothetical protein n=1 Tax=unclassified Paenibacillus TaxID=185978 RepID=UPI001EF9747E|nr:hypothetical protein [Paenibacillus sp. H1-7]ULL16742.1 hypothetical protein DVH26_21240 [Paenibacillus sp. H1-7]